MTEKRFIVDSKKRRKVDHAAKRLGEYTPTQTRELNGANLQSYELNTLGGPMAVSFIRSIDSQSSEPDIFAFEPEIPKTPGPSRLYLLSRNGEFLTSVETEESAAESKDSLQLLYDAGIYIPTEHEWHRFEKLVKDVSYLMSPMGSTALKLINLFNRNK